MDKLLNLLEKYRCHLNRGNKTSVEFLQENFAKYIEDVREALSPADNPLVGEEMCNMVSAELANIESNSKHIIEVLGLYSRATPEADNIII